MITPKEYFLDIIKKNDKYSGFESDLGIILMAETLDFKINQVEERRAFNIQELSYPQTEEILLAKLLYEVGYVRFTLPLVVQCFLTSQETITLYGGFEFTSGDNLFMLDETILTLTAGEPTLCHATLQQVHKEEITLSHNRVYSKHVTGFSYKEIHKIQVSKDGELLKYSQNFIDYDADYSYEIDPLTNNVVILFLKENDKGKNLKGGEVLELSVFTTSSNEDAPEGLAPIDNTQLVVDNIIISQNYRPPLGIEEMQHIIRYGRKSNGDLILNEDYRQHIMKNVSGLLFLKVWQEKEENLETGADISNINKIFYSYILEGDETTPDSERVNNLAINTQIQKTIGDAVIAKETIFKEAIIVTLNLNINITTEETHILNTDKVVKSALVGYYDDSIKLISQAQVYKKVFTSLKNKLNVFDLTVEMDNKGIKHNQIIYKLDKDSVNVTINGN